MEELVTIDAADPAARLTPDEHRALAARLFNFTWTLIERPERTADDVDTMIHAAHASAWHWLHATGTTPNNRARSEWQCSRVYAVLRRPEAALWHARRVLEICQSNGIGDWDLAYAYEALARASRVAGDDDAAESWLGQARTAADAISEPEDRAHLEDDLATI
jgi:hypothetical protein